jgi:hypothetical protein
MKMTFKTVLATTVLSLVSANSFAFCTDSSRECVISAATAYLNGIVAHDPANIPFADNVQRWENGVNTAMNAEQLRNSIKNDAGIKLVKGIRDLKWYVDGEDAIAFFVMDAAIGKSYVGTTHIFERFHVENGLISEVEATFCYSFTLTPEDGKIQPPTKLSFLCKRG